jgi:hypothetical protein
VSITKKAANSIEGLITTAQVAEIMMHAMRAKRDWDEYAKREMRYVNAVLALYDDYNIELPDLQWCKARAGV